ncbi:AMP-activated serine/threonine-protein kinase regulatory subunit [Sorochytrium milnesiophthora]
MQPTQALTEFLNSHTTYDILSVSFKLIVIDSRLKLKKAVVALLQNGLVAAPLWNSGRQHFDGLLTVIDILYLITHLDSLHTHSHQDLIAKLDSLEVHELRNLDTERVGLQPIHLHPSKSVLEASRVMLQCSLHHLPLVDADSVTSQETIVSVLSGYKILRFLACNAPTIDMLDTPLSERRIGTFDDLAVVGLQWTVLQAVQLMLSRKVSALPILDNDRRLVDVFTETDVLIILKDFPNVSLHVSIQDSLNRRPLDFEPVHTCLERDTLASLFATIKRTNVTRFLVTDEDRRLVGIISLGNLLRFVIGNEHPAAV